MRLLGLLGESFLVVEEVHRSQVPVIVQASLATHLSVPATQVSERGCSLPQVMLSLLEENTFSPSMLSNSFIHSNMH